MKYTVYLRTNKVNGKQYVGQTENFEQREKQWGRINQKYSNKQIAKDRKEYGLENFEVEILAEVDTREEACELEVKYIKELNTLHPNGYNVATGGAIGFKYQEDIMKERGKSLSKALTGRHLSEEHKKKISVGNKGKKVPLESRLKISKALKGNPFRGRWKPIVQVKENGEVVFYDCIKQVAENGYKKQNVSECCNKHYIREGNNVYRGSEWYFRDEYNKKLLEELTS